MIVTNLQNYQGYGLYPVYYLTYNCLAKMVA